MLGSGFKEAQSMALTDIPLVNDAVYLGLLFPHITGDYYYYFFTLKANYIDT